MKKISKKDKLLALLKANENKFVSVWVIIMTVKTAHHTELIRLLRKEYTIENKLSYEEDWSTYSSYKLIS